MSPEDAEAVCICGSVQGDSGSGVCRGEKRSSTPWVAVDRQSVDDFVLLGGYLDRGDDQVMLFPKVSDQGHER